MSYPFFVCTASYAPGTFLYINYVTLNFVLLSLTWIKVLTTRLLEKKIHASDGIKFTPSLSSSGGLQESLLKGQLHVTASVPDLSLLVSGVLSSYRVMRVKEE